MGTDNDRILLIKISMGDEQSFSKLFDRYRSNIYTSALRMTGVRQVAEEILQDTFLKVWTKRTELPAIVNFPGWLHTIAENLTFNALKKVKRERQYLLEMKYRESNPYTSDTEDLYHQKEYDQLLERAVRRLPPKQRQTYLLLKQDGRRRSEVASILEVSPETVKWNLDQAMRNIRAFCMSSLDLPVIALLLLYFL
jgi:RNA polymerase sigma factor (sigma-70 family)